MAPEPPEAPAAWCFWGFSGVSVTSDATVFGYYLCSMPFVHLVNHSHYSMLRSSIRIEALVAAALADAGEQTVFEDHVNMKLEKGPDGELLPQGKALVRKVIWLHLKPICVLPVVLLLI